MTTVDLRHLPRDEFVVHFGGRPRQVDALTFSYSLISISEILREINLQLNPHHGIEIYIDYIGPGSFRAKIKTSVKKIPGLLKGTATHVVIPIFVWFLTEKLFSDDQINISVEEDYYILERGSDRIILPKQAYEAGSRVQKTEKIETHISKAFEAVARDDSISDLSFAAELEGDKFIAQFHRDDFPRLAIRPTELLDETRRKIDVVRTRLTVIRAILKKSARKWQFVYEGFQISAPISDDGFYDRLAKHEYEFGQGDILDADLKIVRTRDEENDVFINDPNGYEVTCVYDVIKAPRQRSFLG